MLNRHKESATLGFRHLSRPLKPGEPLPRLPSLMEQVMACRFELCTAEPDPESVDDFDADDEWEDESQLDS
jgi:hypothetical protein